MNVFIKPTFKAWTKPPMFDDVVEFLLLVASVSQLQWVFGTWLQAFQKVHNAPLCFVLAKLKIKSVKNERNNVRFRSGKSLTSYMLLVSTCLDWLDCLWLTSSQAHLILDHPLDKLWHFVKDWVPYWLEKSWTCAQYNRSIMDKVCETKCATHTHLRVTKCHP